MELLTVQDAAHRAGVTAKAIYYSLHHGKLTSYREYGKVLVDASEIERYRPRAHPTRSLADGYRHRVLSGRGFLAGTPGSVDEYLARKTEEKALDR